MYIIVTKDLKIVERAKKNNDSVLELNIEENTVSLIGDSIPKNSENLISNFLIKVLGIHPNLKGFKYLKFLIKYSLDNPGFEESPITSVIYPLCAKEFSTTPTRVERAIRHSIMKGFSTNRYKKEYINVFGNAEKLPTNAQFFNTTVLYIRENVV